MRLLLRANSHRPVWADDALVGVEIAASPDTPTRPERWAWHIRLLDDRAPLDVVPNDRSSDGAQPPSNEARTVKTQVALSPGVRGTLEVEVDPLAVDARTEVFNGADVVLDRPEEQLLAVVASSGDVVVEDRHRLSAGDAMVLTGDDPLSVTVSTVHGAAVVIRLNAPNGQSVSWVP